MSTRSTSDLEQRTLRAMQAEWRMLNVDLLDGSLCPPVLGLFDGSGSLGRWERASRNLLLSRRLVLERPWGKVRAVLAHEMAHQYADEVLHAHHEVAHGPAFRRTCARMGISPQARGEPPPEEAETRTLRRVLKLLALAQSPNEHEARLAAAHAQRLMLEHNLEELESRNPLRYAARQLGPVKARFSAHEKVLSGLLASHFFVQCLWMTGFDVRSGRPGRYLEISGTPENLDMAAWVHAFLLETGERLWREHRHAARLAGDGERRRFLAGVIIGFDEQLRGQAQRNQQEGLVWVGDRGLQDYYARCHPRIRTRSGPRVATTGAWHQGKAAGRGIVLHKPVTSAPARRTRQIGG